MQPCYIGIDLAIAKHKHLPVVVCTWEQGRLIPQPLRRLGLTPPQGMGNVASLDRETVHRFAHDTMTYVVAVCNRLGLHPTRIGIDAPSAPRNSELSRRAAESALDRAGISCFATPSTREFAVIDAKVTQHLAGGGAEAHIPHSNQLWMLVGFAVFNELSRLAPCLEVFPQATARAVGSGQAHKSQPGAVQAQLRAVACYTNWPLGRIEECGLEDIAWGASHDRLDAYLSAWVASMDEPDRMAYGRPPDDVIWVPKILRLHALPSLNETSVRPRHPSRPPSGPSVSLPCPGCGQKEFKRWPWGWDAHAAHRCQGLSATDPEERKREFRLRFADYFPQ